MQIHYNKLGSPSGSLFLQLHTNFIQSRNLHYHRFFVRYEGLGDVALQCKQDTTTGKIEQRARRCWIREHNSAIVRAFINLRTSMNAPTLAAATLSSVYQQFRRAEDAGRWNSPCMGRSTGCWSCATQSAFGPNSASSPAPTRRTLKHHLKLHDPF
jgi:hypothetical protein